MLYALFLPQGYLSNRVALPSRQSASMAINTRAQKPDRVRLPGTHLKNPTSLAGRVRGGWQGERLKTRRKGRHRRRDGTFRR